MAKTKKETEEKPKGKVTSQETAGVIDEETETKKDINVEAKLEAEEEKSEVKKEKKKEEKEVKESSEEKKAKLLERAKKLAGKVKEEKEVSLKEKIKEEKEEAKNLLVPIEDYLKSSIYLGTRVITPDMRKYIYRRRADGLAVFNTTLLDVKLREGAEFLSKFEPKDIIVVCKREAGWKAVRKFAETLGIRYFTKKYPAGILTNTRLSTFQEAGLVFICDNWLDKNAMTDAMRVKTPVLSICDTNNFTRNITHVIPGNNKSAKSLGMIFFLLTKLYIEKKGLKIPVPPIQEFVEDWDNLQPPQ